MVFISKKTCRNWVFIGGFQRSNACHHKTMVGGILYSEKTWNDFSLVLFRKQKWVWSTFFYHFWLLVRSGQVFTCNRKVLHVMENLQLDWLKSTSRCNLIHCHAITQNRKLFIIQPIGILMMYFNESTSRKTLI